MIFFFFYTPTLLCSHHCSKFLSPQLDQKFRWALEEIQHAPSIHEIPATSADENAAEEMEDQAATEEEADIPQPAAPKIGIPASIIISAWRWEDISGQRNL